MRTSGVLGLILSLVLAVASPALAAVDRDVPLNAKVQGTIGKAGVVQMFRFDATAGTVLKVSVSGKGLDLALGLLDPDGNPVTVTSAPAYRDTGSKVSLAKFPLLVTGRWTLTIASAATGDYSLKLKGKAAKKALGTVVVAAGGSTNFDFAAPAGSTVTLKAKAAKGSAAEPRLGAFDGADLTDAGKSSTKSHTVKVAGVSGGDLELAVGNLGASAGDVTVSVKVKAPKLPSEKIDVRGEDSSGTSVSATVVADQGGEVEVEDPASSLAGASVTIAPGALPADTEITIASSDSVAPPLDRQMVGPTLDLGPSGLTFTKPVTVTIPYDPALMAEEDTPSDLLVLHVKQNGEEETLTPTAVDEANHLLTVETTSFSKMGPFGRRRAVSLSGRSYWSMFLDLSFLPDPAFDREGDNSGAEFRSRDRLIRAGHGSIDFSSGTKGTGEFEEIDLAWGHDEDFVGSMEITTAQVSGSVDWGRAGADIVIDEDGMPLAPSADGSVLIGANGSDVDNAELGNLAFNTAQLELMIERSSTVPTHSEIAGDYRFAETFIEVRTVKEGSRLTMAAEQNTGVLTFKRDGSVSVQATLKSIDNLPGQGVFTELGSESGRGGKLPIRSGGYIDAGDIRLYPSADRNILMGMSAWTPRAPDNRVTDVRGVHFIVAVRQSSNMTNFKASGYYEARGLNLEFLEYDSFADLRSTSFDQTARMWIDTEYRFSLSGVQREMGAEPNEYGGVRIEKAPANSTGTTVVWGSGSFAYRDLNGSVTPDAKFGILFDRPSAGTGFFGLTLMVK